MGLIGRVDLTPLSGRRWKILKDFHYVIDINKTKLRFKVPEGFITDFASVPRLFWNIVPPWGKYGYAAIIHDYMYKTGKYGRKTSDKVFLRIMKESKVVWWKRTLMYKMVRLFGWIPYKNHRKNDK